VLKELKKSSKPLRMHELLYLATSVAEACVYLDHVCLSFVVIDPM
jgi:hypothetical protein